MEARVPCPGVEQEAELLLALHLNGSGPQRPRSSPPANPLLATIWTTCGWTDSQECEQGNQKLARSNQ